MFARTKKAEAVERPERDPAFQALRAEQEALHESIERLSVEINTGRGRLDDMIGNSAAGIPVDRPAQTALVKRLNDAHEERHQARRRLRQIADTLPEVRQKAARRIAAEHVPHINRAAGDFLRARMTRLADEITAAAAVLRLRDELAVRRVGLYGALVPGSAVRAADEFARLREDAIAAVQAGVLSSSDIPDAVRTIWGL